MRGVFPAIRQGLGIRRGIILEIRIQRLKGCSVRRVTVPASSTLATRKRAISAAVRIRLFVCNATTRNIHPGSRRWWRCIARMLIIAASR